MASLEIEKENIEDKKVPSIHETLNHLGNFSVEKVLFNNTKAKTVCLQGTFASAEGTGIVLLEKAAFNEEKLTNSDEGFFNSHCALSKDFHNDIYGNYECFPQTNLNGIKTTIIHPATKKHIEKYSTNRAFIIDETPEIYQNYTIPSLSNDQFDLQWVYNILEHKSEAERIVFEDPDKRNGFVLVPDLKWDGKTLETLYLLAIARQDGIKSLRDLDDQHIDLLKNIKTKGELAIKEKYGLDPSRLRIYLHYQPSFYHLHVHFSFIQHEAPGILAERSHLLANVISNLELVPDYYKRVTIPFVVYENFKLCKEFIKRGLINISEPPSEPPSETEQKEVPMQ